MALISNHNHHHRNRHHSNSTINYPHKINQILHNHPLTHLNSHHSHLISISLLIKNSHHPLTNYSLPPNLKFINNSHNNCKNITNSTHNTKKHLSNSLILINNSIKPISNSNISPIKIKMISSNSCFLIFA